MKLIPLNHGYFATVDDEDFESLSQFTWSAHIHARKGLVYAIRSTGPKESRTTISMHRQLLGLPTGDKRQGEHKDGDGLNNRRENLRVATQQQNNANRKMNRRNKSGFRGVSWDSAKQKWRAGIEVNQRCKFLGNFSNPEEAARAWDFAAFRAFGEFARLNFPTLTSIPELG